MADIFKLISIDDDTTRDVDDAIWIQESGEGFKLLVAIADVAKAVPKGHRFDEAARSRIATRYYDGGSNLMLPRFLAEDRLSLLPGDLKGAIITEIALDADARPVGLPRLFKGLVQNTNKLSYSKIPGVLADKSDPLNAQLLLCERVARKLLARRQADGALALYDLTEGWTTTEEGHLVKLDRLRANIGYVIIQEFMVLANAAVARYCADHEIPILFRNHTAKAHAPGRAELLGQVMDAIHSGSDDLVLAVRQRVHMVLNKADYGTTLLGHFGLNLPAYLHSTSPIRRYIDLVNQRQLRAHIKGEDLPYTRGELTVICTAINQELVEREEKRSESFKQADISKAERRAEQASPQQIANFKPVEFERILKVTARSHQPNPAVTEAFRLRAESGHIQPLDTYVALVETSTSDRGLREMALGFLARNPNNAASVLGIATSIAQWPEPDYTSESKGPDHSKVFKVTVRGTSLDLTAEGEGASIKEAKQRAAVGLLAKWAGLAVPTWAFPPPSPKRVPIKKVVLPVETSNPVATLQEYFQQARAPLPEYSFERVGGPDHAPLFTCICRVENREFRSPPSADKKTAKREAAMEAFQGLQAER